MSTVYLSHVALLNCYNQINEIPISLWEYKICNTKSTLFPTSRKNRFIYSFNWILLASKVVWFLRNLCGRLPALKKRIRQCVTLEVTLINIHSKVLNHITLLFSCYRLQDFDIESEEDEEAIIAKRRKQRQELLEVSDLRLLEQYTTTLKKSDGLHSVYIHSFNWSCNVYFWTVSCTS